MGKKTPLYDCHLKAHAKIVDFAGWDMPLHYGSQLQEHHHVRHDAGMFDVSHMTIVDGKGRDIAQCLRRLLANNIDRLTNGKALYTCMLNEQGGVIDDLIVYKITDDFYRLVVNSATRDKDLAWINQQAKGFDVILTERTDLAMVAIQGPNVRAMLFDLFEVDDAQAIADLKPFQSAYLEHFFVGRTGYTGEDGFEVILSAADAPHFWQNCLGVTHCLRIKSTNLLFGITNPTHIINQNT